MLRLTIGHQNQREVLLKVDGWLVEEETALLEQESTRLLEEVDQVILDMDGVRFIDRVGLKMLCRWQGKGLVLRGGSVFLKALLQQQGLESTD